MFVAILGAAGAIGRSVAAELTARGAPYRVAGRDRAKLESAFGVHAEIAVVDLADPEQARRALDGADAAVYAVGVPYSQFELHPKLMRITVEAARQTGVTRLAVISSVYGYGAPVTPRVAESHPREPLARKGRFRKEQEDVALAAGGLVLRLPDFYGPHAEISLADMVFRAALKDEKATWIGPPDLPHEFLFVPDAGPVVADLIARGDSFGHAWNLAGPAAISGREFIGAVYTQAGREPRFRQAGKGLLRLGGIFNSVLREIVEMYYLAETPVILDDSKLQRHLGKVRKTPYAEGIRRTLEYYQSSSTGRN